jgi:hypothetical protein
VHGGVCSVFAEIVEVHCLLPGASRSVDD